MSSTDGSGALASEHGMRKRLVLAGGGHVHLHVLHDLAASRLDGVDVVLVSPDPDLVYSGMVPGVIAGRYAPGDCRIALEPLVERAGATFMRGEVVGMDAGSRRLSIVDGQGIARKLDYDLLSLDTGGVMDRGAIEGAAEHALFVRPMHAFLSALEKRMVLGAARVAGGETHLHADAASAGDAIATRLAGSSVESAGVDASVHPRNATSGTRGYRSAVPLDARTDAALSSSERWTQPVHAPSSTHAASMSGDPDAVVIGGGAAGVELSLALRARLSASARVHLLAGGPLLPGEAAGLVRRTRRALADHGVTWHETACTRIEREHVELSEGTRLPSGLTIVATGSAAPPWLRTSGLTLDRNGFVATGATLQSVSHADVFAAGDVAVRTDVPRPRSGVHAVRAGPPLARNLRHVLAGAMPLPYLPQRHALALLALGDGAAIAAWNGWSARGRVLGWWKDRIDRAFVARSRGG